MVMHPAPVNRSIPGPSARGTLGVTLLELMVVIVMIGILSAVAMSHLDWKRYQADASGRGIMGELSTTQRLALSLQSNMHVTFPDSTRMMILEDANNDGTAGSGERVRYVVLDNNFRFGKANAPDLPAPEDPNTFSTVVFHRDGSADRNGTLYLHGPGADPNCKHCRAVAISRATGRVVWYSYASGSWKRAN